MENVKTMLETDPNRDQPGQGGDAAHSERPASSETAVPASGSSASSTSPVTKRGKLDTANFIVGLMSLLIAVLGFWLVISGLRDQTFASSWALLNSATGKQGDGGRSLALKNLAEIKSDLSRIDLSGMTMDASVIPKRAVLVEALFRNTTIHDGNLQGVNFEKSIWGEQSRLSRIKFVGTNKFNGAHFYDMSFEDCNIGPGAVFEGASFLNCKFIKVRFEECVFWSATFSNCAFSSVIFTNCDLESLRLIGGSLNSVDFRKHSNLKGIHFYGAVATGPLFFDSSDLVRCIFDLCDFSYASFTGARLQQVQFRGTDLRNADFSDVFPPGQGDYGLYLQDVSTANIHALRGVAGSFTNWCIGSGAVDIEDSVQYGKLRKQHLH
jgi:uncharacterized protein YjbI with pentapeptide repeats